MAGSKKIYIQIQGLRESFYKLASGKEQLLKIITEVELYEQVYNSNAIENSTLTLEETEKLLMEIELDRYVTEREIFEAKNLSRVITYITEKAKTQELDLDMMKFLHKMLISNINNEIAGRFRKEGEHVRVGDHIGSNPIEIEEELTQMLSSYHANPHHHIAKRIAKAHLEFEYTHPFIDGNGRIGRVLNNYLLIRDGYVPINITFSSRKDYYNAFKEFQNFGKTTLMEEIIAKALVNSYHKRLAYLEDKKIIPLNNYAKENKLSHSNLLNKAKRATIPAFRERGIWKIGV